MNRFEVQVKVKVERKRKSSTDKAVHYLPKTSSKKLSLSNDFCHSRCRITFPAFFFFGKFVNRTASTGPSSLISTSVAFLITISLSIYLIFFLTLTLANPGFYCLRAF